MSIFQELQRRVGEEIKIILHSGHEVSGKLERVEDGVGHLESGEAIAASEVAVVSTAPKAAEELPVTVKDESAAPEPAAA